MRLSVALGLGLAAVGCSGPDALRGASSRLASAQGRDHPAAPASPSPAQGVAAEGTPGAAAAPAPPPGENTPAGAPTQVSGAFLADCGRALAGGYGCAFLDPVTKKKAPGSVLGAALTLHFDDGTTDTPAVTDAPPASAYHVVFSEDDDRWLAVTSADVAATVDGTAVATTAKTLAYDEVPGGNMDDLDRRYATRILYALTGAAPKDPEFSALVGDVKAAATSGARTSALGGFVINKIDRQMQLNFVAGWAQAFWKKTGSRANLLQDSDVVAVVNTGAGQEMRTLLEGMLKNAKTFAAAGLAGGPTDANYASWRDFVLKEAAIQGLSAPEIVALSAGQTGALRYATAAANIVVSPRYAETVLAAYIQGYWRQAATWASVEATPAEKALLCGACSGGPYVGSQPLLLTNVLAADPYFKLNP